MATRALTTYRCIITLCTPHLLRTRRGMLDEALILGVGSSYLVVLQYSYMYVHYNHQIWASNSKYKCFIQHTLWFWGGGGVHRVIIHPVHQLLSKVNFLTPQVSNAGTVTHAPLYQIDSLWNADLTRESGRNIPSPPITCLIMKFSNLFLEKSWPY